MMKAGLRIALVCAALGLPASEIAAQEAPRSEAEVRSEGRERADRNRPPRQRDVITREQIEQSTHRNAHALIQATNPRWLRPRGSVSMSLNEAVRVYRDGALVGGVGALRDMELSSIMSIRYLDGRAATERFGTDHGAGAILISSTR